MSDAVTVEKDATEALVDQAETGGCLCAAGGESMEIDWDEGVKVTPMGSVVFFTQFLKTGGLLKQLCEATPLSYGSKNAPEVRDVQGTAVLTILNGQTRYAHIGALRADRGSAGALGMSKVVSEDCVRKAAADCYCAGPGG